MLVEHLKYEKSVGIDFNAIIEMTEATRFGRTMECLRGRVRELRQEGQSRERERERWRGERNIPYKNVETSP